MAGKEEINHRRFSRMWWELKGRRELRERTYFSWRPSITSLSSPLVWLRLQFLKAKQGRRMVLIDRADSHWKHNFRTRFLNTYRNTNKPKPQLPHCHWVASRDDNEELSSLYCFGWCLSLWCQEFGSPRARQWKSNTLALNNGLSGARIAKEEGLTKLGLCTAGASIYNLLFFLF